MTDKQLFTRKLKIIQSLIDNLQRKDDIFSQIIYLRQFKEQLGINYKDIINKVNNIYIYMVDDLGMHTNDISILNNQDANKLVLKQFENGNGNNDLVNSFYDKKDLKDSSFILFDNKQNTFSFGSDVIHILPLIKTYIDAMNHFLSTHKQIVLPNEILNSLSNNTFDNLAEHNDPDDIKNHASFCSKDHNNIISSIAVIATIWLAIICAFCMAKLIL